MTVRSPGGGFRTLEPGTVEPRTNRACGNICSSGDRVEIGASRRSAPYFVDALRSNETVFTSAEQESGAQIFAYSRKIEVSGTAIGVIVVEVDLRKFELAWAGFTDAVIVTDSEDAPRRAHPA